MTDQEATETWNFLSTLLKNLDLESVIQRVEAHLRDGRPEAREIHQFEERAVGGDSFFPEDELRRRTGPRSRYLAVVEYTPRERVQILVDAVLHAIVFPRQMEHEIWNYLEKSSDEPERVSGMEVIRIAHETQNEKPVISMLRRQMPLSDLNNLQKALVQIRNEAQK